jgi:hypothetical protein
MRFAANMEVSWCGSLSTLPTREMDFTANPGFINHQYHGVSFILGVPPAEQLRRGQSS